MPEKIAWGLLALGLVLAAVFDCRTGKVPNWLTYPGILVGLAFWATIGLIEHGLIGAGQGLLLAAEGLAAGYVPFMVIFAMGGLGGGDVKLMAMVGALSASWECVLGTAVYGLMLAMLLAIAIMVRRRIVRRTVVRLVNVVFSAAARVKIAIPDDSPRVPLALPLGIGGILAGAEWLLHARLPWSAGW